MMMKLKMLGNKPKGIAETLTKEFGTPRSALTVGNKIRTLMRDGLPDFDRMSSPVVSSFEEPKNAVEAYAQCETAIKILGSLQKYLENRRSMDVEAINISNKLRKIQETVGGLG
jgi:hypothetical protein